MTTVVMITDIHNSSYDTTFFLCVFRVQSYLILIEVTHSAGCGKYWGC